MIITTNDSSLLFSIINQNKKNYWSWLDLFLHFLTLFPNVRNFDDPPSSLFNTLFVVLLKHTPNVPYCVVSILFSYYLSALA